MLRCRVDQSLQRTTIEGFAFPLGSYPVEPMTPTPGYQVWFEPADGGEEEGDFEEWPDRYAYDIAVSSDRLDPLVSALLSLLPGRVYPILDVLGQDAYREVDPYVAYHLVGLERLIDGLRTFRPFFLEDGLVGFGAMSEEPFVYIFVDEHKVISVRVETALQDKVDRVLAAFDLKEVPEVAAADAVTHEHRGVLWAPDDRPDLLTADEIVEMLRESWGLTLNVDAESNLDDEGRELGITGWRCVVRVPAADDGAQPRYAEIMLTADSLALAEELALAGTEKLVSRERRAGGKAKKVVRTKSGGEDRPGPEDDGVMVVSADRMTPEEFGEMVRRSPGPKADLRLSEVWRFGWL